MSDSQKTVSSTRVFLCRSRWLLSELEGEIAQERRIDIQSRETPRPKSDVYRLTSLKGLSKNDSASSKNLGFLLKSSEIMLINLLFSPMYLFGKAFDQTNTLIGCGAV